MKTVLWLCNGPIERTGDSREGTVFTAMGHALTESGEFRLAAVTQAKVKSVTRSDTGNILQWVVPFEPLGRDGLPSRQTVEAIQQVTNEIKPDLIHIWGTENYWGLLTARGLLAAPAVLEIAGLKYACSKIYYGGLSWAERVGCIGPLEVLLPRMSLIFGKRRFERWGQFEKEMILQHKYISTQSNWVRAHVQTVKPGTSLFNTGIMLRGEFYKASMWKPSSLGDASELSIFSSSAGAPAYKGLHILMRAISILKKKYPKIVLNVAGDIMKVGIKKSGYSRFLQAEARRLSIAENIHWLGPLNADEFIRYFLRSSVVVIPSFVETYSLAMAEAMLVGVPVVASYAGAMPELARDGESALFFPPGDEVACAWQIDRILSDKALAESLSQNAYRIGLLRNAPHAVLERQLSIYNGIIDREKNVDN